MDILKKIETIGIKLPLTLYVIGFFVHNAYLVKYSVFEFDVLQTRYIYSGFTSVAIIVLVIVLFILRLDLSDFTNNLKPLHLFAWVARLPIFSVLFYFYLVGTEPLAQGYFQNVFGITIARKVVGTIFLFSNLFICGLLFVSFGAVFKRDFIWISKLKTYLAWLSVPMLVGVNHLTYYYKELDDIFMFMFFLGIVILTLLSGASDTQRGIVFHSEAVPNSNSELSRIFIRVVYPFILFIQIAFIFLSYSNRIYPLIQANYGGAKPYKAIIVTKNDTLQTRIVSENATWIITLSSDTSNVLRIKSSDIDKLEMIRK